MRSMPRFISNNSYVILGIFLGLLLSSLISQEFDVSCPVKVANGPQELKKQPQEPKPVKTPPKKAPPPVSRNGKRSKPIRPRYYSTELGIRDKLFVGIFTSEEKIESQAVAINKTLNRIVEKIRFFITAHYKLKTQFNASGIVGFTDTRPKYRPFQVIKYVGDNFLQDFDYFYFGRDFTFVNGPNLMELVEGLSVSMDVYMGAPVADGSFCNLDSGVIFSNSVLNKTRRHLDWCVMNAISDNDSENVGRCVHHSTGLTCQKNIHREIYETYKLKHFDLAKNLAELSEKPDFRKALTIQPILEADAFHLLNVFFLRLKLEEVQKIIDNTPPLGGYMGIRPAAKPATRFDLNRQIYFNASHVFHPDDFTNIRPHTNLELQDIENVLEEVRLRTQEKKGAAKMEYRRLINGYRTFDLSRGLDYILDLGYRDLHTGKEVQRRFQVTKPLGHVEFVPVPYVTENSRITALLPIQETEIPQALSFLAEFTSSILVRKEKTFLMLVLLYQANSQNKGEGDVFGKIKNETTRIAALFRHKSDESLKILWVSVRLPHVTDGTGFLVEKFNALKFAFVDLALKKIGLESLVLVLHPHATVSNDFLNRVRMNTIPGFQVFAPIPFRFYNPKIAKYDSLEIGKNSGHFDKDDYRFVSFYSRDYVEARKRFQHKVPIIRTDADIEKLTENPHGNIFEMFVAFGGEIHPLRATENGLKIRYYDSVDGKCEFQGTKDQLGRLLMSNPKISALFTNS